MHEVIKEEFQHIVNKVAREYFGKAFSNLTFPEQRATLDIIRYAVLDKLDDLGSEMHSDKAIGPVNPNNSTNTGGTD